MKQKVQYWRGEPRWFWMPPVFCLLIVVSNRGLVW
ncbi:Uncharacterised protein [Mycobacteroides abscessus subsp. abscessus]|nr:Uncharacterised protein [Mycobacteroides abscessus subsp. abscessus]SLC30651.1 Uncharacterised protein [Mycobacteroides abscessus subsp. massiliense]SHX37478.1 Uncharacterised protein [Mycobacteroides abscessus subsp. abscessus]SIA58312.1 Uncharacterised protein [Mycobacteroides abscessus subsp. abscessus]SIA65775.1 Uncharacterised protein [Mycobacteroides abscessus subsp. abscessus]